MGGHQLVGPVVRRPFIQRRAATLASAAKHVTDQIALYCVVDIGVRP